MASEGVLQPDRQKPGLTRLGGLGLAVCLALGLTGSATKASAQGTFQAIQSYSTDGTVGFVNGTLGWSFQTTAPITLTGLGCFTNALGADGMAIGIWQQSDGSLLASNLVTTVSDLVGLSRYESTAPIFLDPGMTYYVGAYNPAGTTSLEIGTWPPLIVAPDIIIGGLAKGTGGFVCPASEPGTGGMVYLGANFTFTERVPEPSSLALLGFAGVLWAIRRRR